MFVEIMKKIYSILLCIGLVAGFVACEKDKEFALTTLSINNEVITPAYNSADVRCSFKTDATISDAYVQYALSSSFAKYEVAKMTEEKGIYTAQLVGLADNTTYYIRYEVSNKYSSVVTEEVKEFQTLQCAVPTIVLDTIGEVRASHAKVQIHLTFDGGASVTDMGVCWSKQTHPTIEDIHKSTKDTLAVLDMTDLQPNTKYYIRAYAMNKVGVAYSEEKEFTTYALPEVRTEDVSDIQVNSALLSATLVFDGNDTATIKGFCWSDKSEPTIEGDHIAIDTASAGYTYALTSLLSETQYFVRAYAQNKIGIVYGEEKSFTTNKSVVLPSVTTTAITKITETSAVAGGNVTSDGNASVTERGVCIATIANPTVANTKITAGNGVGAFTCELTGLQEGTKYYVRAYAVNSKGTAYGEEVVFTTSVAGVPTVTTTQPSSITETTAVAGGNVTSNGGASVSERGVVYSLSANPAITNLSSTIVRSGNGTGAFTCNLSNLQAGTTYYVRAYAINNKGTAYGDEVSFTTAVPITLATVTTASITNITETTAKAGGTVTNDGNASVTERGVVYSTNENPTIANNKLTNGSGTGSFTCNLTGLQANTTYYVRAYAVNSKGTAYGEEVSFTTKEQSSTEPGVTETITVNGVSFKMVAVEGGTFTMGATAEQGLDLMGEASPTHSVTLSDFLIGETEVTKELWYAVMEINSGSSSELKKPIVNVSWGSCQTFISKLNYLTGKRFRLPTEAEWEYAARGGNKTQGYMYAGSNNPNDVAWYKDNCSNTTHPVQQKMDNELGIYDMSGNVSEWCLDWYGTYSSSAQTNPIGLTSGTFRVRRGGSILSVKGGCRVSNRLNATPTDSDSDAGFRLAIGEAVKMEIVLPSITTTKITQIAETTAVAGGHVTSDGNGTVSERGVVYSTSPGPTISNLSNTICPCGSGTGEFIYNMTNLQPNTTYYVRAYAVNEKGTAYGEQVNFTTRDELSESTNSENGHTYVDLGLSVKWATCNVGASSLEEYGDFFAWGETEPKEIYDWSTYKWCEGANNKLTKYNTNSSDGVVDNKITLDLSDDAARVNWGGRWRTPTVNEINELSTKCTWTWNTQNGVKGYKITSNSNGKSIFIPAAGYRWKDLYKNAGSDGYYMLNSLYRDESYEPKCDAARYAYFWMSNRYNNARTDRAVGYSVRPVLGEEYVYETTLPTVTTKTVTQITETSATTAGDVTADGNASLVERGVVYSTSQNPTTANMKIKAGSGIGNFTCNLTGLQPNTTYYVRAYAVNSKGTAYGSQVSFTTKEQSSTPNNGTENGYAYVDLGLSVKWATCNVGANNPEDYGDYFAWGETTSTKNTYDWSTYKYCNGSSSTLTKYNTSSSFGTVDNKTQLELSDDAARVNWGGSWRMPTDAEWIELMNNCTDTWTTQNGVNGYRVTSKTNGNSIFLPAAGFRFDSSRNDAGGYGYYWSSSLYTDDPRQAWDVHFDFDSGVVSRDYFNRYYGRSVRPVCP